MFGRVCHNTLMFFGSLNTNLRFADKNVPNPDDSSFQDVVGFNGTHFNNHWCISLYNTQKGTPD